MLRPGADNRGPLLNIGSWFTMVAMLLFSAVKIYTKWSVLGKLQYDDLFVIAAAVCDMRPEKHCAPCRVGVNTKQTAAIAHCISISEEVSKGLGQHQARVNSQTLNDYYIVGPSMQFVLCSWTVEVLMSLGCIYLSDFLYLGHLDSQTCRSLLFHQFDSAR